MSNQSSAYIYDIGGDVKGILGDVKGGVVNQYIIAQKSQAEIHSQRLRKGSPYLGLKKFGSEDKDKFFGREQWINKLSQDLEQNNLLLLLGASGSGKSSLVQAGILPNLSDEWGASRLIKLIFVPYKNPFESLYHSLPNIYKNRGPEIINEKTNNILIRLINELKEDSQQWLIFIDQFEEIFIRTPKLECDKFIASLVSLIRQQDNSIKLIIAMRSDFLDNLREYGDFTNEVESQIRLIRDMTESELRLAIAEPAARNGVTFEKGLVEQIISDFYNQAGSLPLLQYTLDLLWEEDGISDNNRVLNINTYNDLGGVAGALQKQADYIYQKKLNDEEKKAAEKIFLELIDLAVKEPVSRRVEKSQFKNDPVIERTLNKLIEQRLLVSGRNDEIVEVADKKTVEVAHEELLRSWGFVKNLILEKEEIIILRSRLIGDAYTWYELRNKEKAKDELWSGSKLVRVLELINKKAFGSLDEKSKQFIQASVERRDRLEREKKESERRELEDKVALETAEEKNQILAEANQKAKRRIQIGSIILVLSLFIAGIASYRLQLLNQVEKTLKATIGRLGIEKRGLAYYTFGDPDTAIEYFEKSLETARQIKDRRGEGYALGNLGIAYYSQGDYGKAIDYHQRHLNIAQEISDRQGEGEALGNIGKVYFIVGQYDRAIEYHKQHLVISQSIGDRQSEAYAIGNLGLVHHALKQYDQAIDYHQKHLAISQQIQDVQGQGQALGNLGIIYQAQGEYLKAIEYHQKHLTICKEIQDIQGEGQALVNLGQAYLALEEREQVAIGYLQEGLAIVRKIKDRSLEGIALANLGNAFLKLGNLFLAEKKLRASIQVLESLRSGLEDIHKISILETQANIYRDLQKVLIAQNKPYAALEISERMRARTSVELLRKRLSPKSKSQLTIQFPNIKQIRQIAQKHNATLVEYSIIYDEKQRASELFIWVVQPTGQIDFRQFDLKSLDISLELILQRSRASIGIRAGIIVEPLEKISTTPTQRLQKLYQLLIEPISDLLPKDPNAHIIFIPHREIFTVSFPALQDAEGNYLIEKHTILTAPAIQVLDFTHRQRQRIEGVEGDILIVGNPVMPAISIFPGEPPQRLGPLPGAEKEATAIAKMFNGIPIIGTQATETAVVSKMPTSKIIHFATHAIMTNLELPKRDTGAIVLAASETDDGLLTSEEIQSLTLNAELVVVSACETTIRNITEEGVIGLSRSLLTAGASSLIVALWTISDQSTAVLMVEFYRNLQRNPDKAQALRQAMITTMKTHPDPRDWAGFTLIGEAI